MPDITKPKAVYVVGNDHATILMFNNAGVELAKNIEGADFVVFTGGSDVDPKLYGHGRLVETRSDINRDQRDLDAHLEAAKLKKPMVGICRGAQFLNVMNGGYLIQDVDGHHHTHSVYDIERSKYIQCTSTHHQMMVPLKPQGRVIGIVPQSRCSYKRLSNAKNIRMNLNASSIGSDVEVVWYKSTKNLCFQPHPEYNIKECTQWFFDLLEMYIV